MITMREAYEADMREIAPLLRQSDAEEIRAAFGISAEDALVRSLKRAYVAMICHVDNKPLAVFGVGPLSVVTGTGCPWLVATDEIEHCKRDLLEASPQVIEQFHNLFQTLVNWVDARNKRTIRWLKWLGFHMEPAKPWGYAGLPFHKFTKRAS